MTAAASRRFCAVCGRMLRPRNRTFAEPFAYCFAHADLAAVDGEAVHPLESLPMQADGLRPCQVCGGNGRLFDLTECPNCNGSGLPPASRGRAVSPSRERGE